MSAEYVRNTYKVDYQRGDRVTVDGCPGTIVSFPDQYLGVRFDARPTTTVRAHPTWRVERTKSSSVTASGGAEKASP